MPATNEVIGVNCSRIQLLELVNDTPSIHQVTPVYFGGFYLNLLVMPIYHGHMADIPKRKIPA